MATKLGWFDILLLCVVGGGCIAFSIGLVSG